MKLIHFKGLNCYMNCIVTIAASWGVAYEHSFCSLWSETVFDYYPRHHAYTSRRMVENLGVMGARLEQLKWAKEGGSKRFPPLPKGTLMIVEMDAFDIPWSPIYQALHDPHYFIARVEGPDWVLCFDPTYGKEELLTPQDKLAPNALDLFCMRRAIETPFCPTAAQEAQQVLLSHQMTCEGLLKRINACAEERQNASSLARYVDALINNRHLFLRFFQACPNCEPIRQFFDPEFFCAWEAVKNGLYKASLIKGNQAVLLEVCERLERLIQQEMHLAQQILSKSF